MGTAPIKDVMSYFPSNTGVDAPGKTPQAGEVFAKAMSDAAVKTGAANNPNNHLANKAVKMIQVLKPLVKDKKAMKTGLNTFLMAQLSSALTMLAKTSTQMVSVNSL